MDLKNKQLKEAFGNLVTIGTSAGTPTTGGLENGNGDNITQVGIGTDSPSFPFHAYHATTDTIAQFESGDASVAINLVASDNSLTVSTSSTDGLLKNNGAGNLRFFNNGSERMRIDSSGNVGIGTQTSSHPLTVRGASTLDTVVTYAKFEGGPTSQPSLSIGGNNTTTVGDRYAWIQAEQSDGTPTTHLVLNKDGGNVGIGTDSPGTTLDVTGGGTGNLIHVGDGTSSSQFMSFRGNGQSGAYIGWDGAGMLLQPGAGKEFKIKTGNVTFTNGSLAFLIDTSGNVGIGTTSPGAKLQVEGDLDVRTASNKNLHIRSFPSFDNFSNQGVGLSMSRTSSDADLMAVGVVDTDKLGLFSRSGIIFATGGNNAFQHTSEVVRIDGSGNVGIGTASNSTFALEVVANATDGVLAVKNGTNDANTFRSSNAGGTRTLDIGNNSSGHGILNIRNSSGSVQTQIQGSGDSFFTGNIGFGTSSPENNLHIAGTNIVAMTLQAPTHNSGVASTATMNYKYETSGGSAIGKIQLVERDTNSFSGKFVFGLPFSDSGSQSTRDIMTIDFNGDILPALDNTSDLGGSSNRFDDIHATNGTIQTSDRNQKQDFEQITEAEAKVAQKAKGLLTKYKLIKDVQKYGDDAQYHIGIIAQDLIAAFEEEGLDYKKYAMIYESEHLEDSGEITKYYGVRYTELLAFIITTL